MRSDVREGVQMPKLVMLVSAAKNSTESVKQKKQGSNRDHGNHSTKVSDVGSVEFTNTTGKMVYGQNQT